jgi:bifunctional non-homologous end joining protein LigD
VKWDEVEACLKKNDPKLLVFESSQVLERVEKMGDLFEPVLTLKQKLPKLAGIEKSQPEAIARGLEIAAQAEEPAPAKKTAAKKKSASKKTKV